MMFDRIIYDTAILGCKPIIKGTRISVEFILELFASGGSIADIVRNYPFLTEEDVRQAVGFADQSHQNEMRVMSPHDPAPKWEWA